jgi:hypothetical protein
LAVGSSWTYEVVYPMAGEQTVKLVAEKDGFLVDTQNGGFKHTAEGLRDKDRYLIRHPLVAGTSWKTVVGPSAIEHAQIVSVGEPCTAAAGKFGDCVVVHGWIRRDETMTLHIEWSWARGVGLVKIETAAEVKGKGKLPQTKQTLKSYTLAGAPAPAAAPATVDDAPGTWVSE